MATKKFFLVYTSLLFGLVIFSLKKVSQEYEKQQRILTTMLFRSNALNNTIDDIYNDSGLYGHKHTISIESIHSKRKSSQYDQRMNNVTMEEIYRQHLLDLHSSNNTYVPNGHATIFVPQLNHTTYYYSTIEEMMLRNQRFPSIQDRVKLYMSNWYIPPCKDNVAGHIQYTYLTKTYIESNDQNKYSTVQDNVLPISTTTTVILKPINSGTQQKLISIDTTYSRSAFSFLYKRDVIMNCTNNLCYDAHQFFIPYVDHYYYYDNNNNNNNNIINNTGSDTIRDVPLILQHGDSSFFRATDVSPSVSDDVLVFDNSHDRESTAQRPDVFNPNIPIMKKFRRYMNRSEIITLTELSSSNNNNNNYNQESKCYSQSKNEYITSMEQTNYIYQPIVSIVSNFGRHFNRLNQVADLDIPWEQKISKAIYRGACTGKSKSKYNTKIILRNNVSEYDICQQIPRCRLVYDYSNSTLVDAKLTPSSGRDKSYTVNDVLMMGNTLTMSELLQYKGLLILEGNDVSSGLKWALFSRSVIFTHQPTFTSWAMEELLIPWVHYIPIANDLSDIEEKVQWMIDHDTEAQEIANNGHLWITDMMYHPDSMRDHEAIIQETFRRYRAHFMYNDTLLSSPSSR